MRAYTPECGSQKQAVPCRAEEVCTLTQCADARPPNSIKSCWGCMCDLHLCELHTVIKVISQGFITSAAAQSILLCCRYNYVTPTSYLELLNTFLRLLGEKRADVSAAKKRLESGLDKLSSTAAQVRAACHSHRQGSKEDIYMSAACGHISLLCTCCHRLSCLDRRMTWGMDWYLVVVEPAHVVLTHHKHAQPILHVCIAHAMLTGGGDAA